MGVVTKCVQETMKAAAIIHEYLPEGLNIVGTVGTTGEIGQVELDLVPAFIQSHGHGADERLDTGGGLVVGSSESASNVLVIENLDFESEVFLQLY